MSLQFWEIKWPVNPAEIIILIFSGDFVLFFSPAKFLSTGLFQLPSQIAEYNLPFK